jgi:hypothetical protein
VRGDESVEVLCEELPIPHFVRKTEGEEHASQRAAGWPINVADHPEVNEPNPSVPFDEEISGMRIRVTRRAVHGGNSIRKTWNTRVRMCRPGR